MSGPRMCGLVLAAGGGRRFGGAKSLARQPDGTAWLALAVGMLRAGGCDEVLVTLGASAEEARELVPAGAVVIPVLDWTEGIAASLRAGLRAAADTDAEAVIVTPVDTPDASPAAVSRLVEAVGPDLRDALAQAVYAGAPGHPVLLGRAHWIPLAAGLRGDTGARAYLVEHDVVEVECGDLWSGADIDSPPIEWPPPAMPPVE